jgi:hypothetical protein
MLAHAIFLIHKQTGNCLTYSTCSTVVNPIVNPAHSSRQAVAVVARPLGAGCGTTPMWLLGAFVIHLVIGVAEAAWSGGHPCTQPALATQPFCDEALPTAERAAALQRGLAALRAQAQGDDEGAARADGAASKVRRSTPRTQVVPGAQPPPGSARGLVLVLVGMALVWASTSCWALSLWRRRHKRAEPGGTAGGSAGEAGGGGGGDVKAELMAELDDIIAASSSSSDGGRRVGRRGTGSKGGKERKGPKEGRPRSGQGSTVGRRRGGGAS